MKKQRKTFLRRAEVPQALLRRLNRGEEEALTLAEVLVVDFTALLRHAFPDLPASCIARMRELAGAGWVARTKAAGEILHDHYGARGLDKTLGHASDQVRGWGACVIAAQPKLTLKKRLELVRPIADDANAGVREAAWIFLRPRIAENLDGAFRALVPWTEDDSANLRRYASEITRPRGVWCAHIRSLRDDPAPGLRILEPLRADPSRYVQNSVANWLNDASKDAPAFVRSTCRRWSKESKAKETAYICRRAQRTLDRED